jgi:hypothetical protein
MYAFEAMPAIEDLAGDDAEDGAGVSPTIPADSRGFPVVIASDAAPRVLRSGRVCFAWWLSRMSSTTTDCTERCARDRAPRVTGAVTPGVRRGTCDAT